MSNRHHSRTWPAYVMVILTFTWCLYINDRRTNDIEATRVSSRQVDYQNCLAGNDTRKAITDLVIAATRTDVDYDTVPSFSLMDLTVQNFFNDLNLRNESNTILNLSIYAQQQLPQRDCTPLLQGEQPIILK